MSAAPHSTGFLTLGTAVALINGSGDLFSVELQTSPCMSADFSFTRYSFTSRCLCTNQSSFHCPLPPALPALLQYNCTSIAHCTPPRPTPPLYAIHHTILAIAISCKGQPPTGAADHAQRVIPPNSEGECSRNDRVVVWSVSPPPGAKERREQ